MVDSQSRSSSHQARMLGAGDKEEKEAGTPELVSPCWGHLEANYYPESNISTRNGGDSPQGSRQLPAMAETTPFDMSIAHLNFASLSSLSSLANSYTFLVGVWRIIKDLAQSVLATVPGQMRRILFPVQLKNKKIFSLHFLCLSCNAYDSGGIFSSRKFFFFFKKNLELLQDSRASRCGK